MDNVKNDAYYVLCKINNGTLDYSTIASSLNDTDTLKKIL